MEAFVRKFNNRYYLIGGNPVDFSESSRAIGEYSTRREALRNAKRMGFEVVIRNRDSVGKENLNMGEALSIQLVNRDMYERGSNDGVWVKLPVSADELMGALERVGVAGGEHGVDFFISDFQSSIPAFSGLPIENLRRVGIDELNFLAGQLDRVSPELVERLSASLGALGDSRDVSRVAEAVRNAEFFTHLPDVKGFAQLGQHYLDSGRITMPEEWKGAVDVGKLGQLAAAHEQGVFTVNGYVLPSDEGLGVFNEMPDDYRIEQQIMSREPGNMEMENMRLYDSVAVQAANVKPAVDKGFQPKPITTYDKVKEALKDLEAGIKAVFESGQYEKYLKTLSKFHNYSYGNCVLITSQRPDATQVAGFNFWRDNFKRHVKKGEKGIKILAPASYKTKRDIERVGSDGKVVLDPSGKPKMDSVEVTVPGYKTVFVFDVSQTYGEPMPTLGVGELTGSVDKYKDLSAAFEKFSPVPVKFEKFDGDAKGYYDQINKNIVIRDGMSQQQNLKTMIHEISHSRLHDIDMKTKAGDERPDSRTREVEAESIAYTVCQHYGVDTSDYSFGYIAGWSSGKELTELKASLGTIRKEADTIITEVNKQLKEMKKEVAREGQLAKAPPVKQAEQADKPEEKKQAEKTTQPKKAASKPQGKTATKRKAADKAEPKVAQRGKEPVFTSIREELAYSKIQATKQRTAEQKAAMSKSKSASAELG